MRIHPISLIAAGLAVLGFAGCAHIGPNAVVSDRVRYNDAIATSWKQQTLLNIVRLRYGDVPEFIDIPSIVGGYSFDRAVSASSGISRDSENLLANAFTFGLAGSRNKVDRPTVTFAPQTGAEFTRNLVNPIPPVALLSLLESGAPADVVLDLAVESINGIRNRQASGGTLQEADPEFQQVKDLMGKCLATGLISLRLVPGKDKADASLLLAIRSDRLDASTTADLARLRQILHVPPTGSEFHVVFGMIPRKPDEIAFRTRSVMRILTYLGIDVDAPAAHIKDGRVVDLGGGKEIAHPQFRAHCGDKKPQETFAAVRYQNTWFWIENNDFRAKRAVAYLKILLALANTGAKDAAPVLTIQAN